MHARCDVRDSAAYAVHRSAFGAFSALLAELQAEPAWARPARGRPPLQVPWIDIWLPAHFENLYAVPQLAAQSHKTGYGPWQAAFYNACFVPSGDPDPS